MKNEEKLFDLVSEYQPQGDQPKAIKELVEGIKEGHSSPFAHWA